MASSLVPTARSFRCLLRCLLCIGALPCLAANEPANFTAEPDTLRNAPQLPLIAVEGNHFIVRETGETIVFRGLALSDPESLLERGQWSRRYFEEAASWNANIVRIPVHPGSWRKLGEETYLAMLDQAITWSGELGMYVIIDWHTIGNLLTGVFHRDSYLTSRDETFRFWYTIVSRYQGNSTVAFYELYNEPTNSGGKMGPLDWEEYATFVEGLISMIYAHDDTVIPLVAGFDWGYDLSGVAERPIRFPGVAYVTHPYPQKRPEPWPPIWEKEWGFVARDYPIIATEFGFMSADEPGAHNPVVGDERYGAAIVDFFEERGISWTVWVFDPLWSPQLFKEWENYTPTRQGTFFREKFETLNR